MIYCDNALNAGPIFCENQVFCLIRWGNLWGRFPRGGDWYRLAKVRWLEISLVGRERIFQTKGQSHVIARCDQGREHSFMCSDQDFMCGSHGGKHHMVGDSSLAMMRNSDGILKAMGNLQRTLRSRISWSDLHFGLQFGHGWEEPYLVSRRLISSVGTQKRGKD